MNRYNIGGTVTAGVSNFASFIVARQQQKAISEKTKRDVLKAEQEEAQKIQQQSDNYKNYKRDARFKDKELTKYADRPEMQAIIHKNEARETDPKSLAAIQERFGVNAQKVIDRERSGRSTMYENQAIMQQPLGKQAVAAYTAERTGIINERGKIDSNIGQIDPDSPLGQKIMGGLK